MNHVFISYSRKDQARAYEFERRLEAAGVRVWIDKTDIPPGAQWPDHIAQAIQQASAVLLLWSGNAADSEWVGKEIACALAERDKRPGFEIAPFCLDDTRLPDNLAHFHAHSLAVCRIPLFIERWQTKPLARKFSDLVWQRTLEQQGAQPVPGLELVTFRLLQSIHCEAHLVTPASADLSQLKQRSPRRLAVFLETTRGASQLENLRMVRDAWRERFPDDVLFLLHVTGPKEGNEYRLRDTEPNGQWLDLVAATHAAIAHLIGTGPATLQFFAAAPVGLGLAVGWRLERYWDLEVFHFPYRSPAYQLVLATSELGKPH